MTSWVTADTHAWHKLMAVERGFASPEQMTVALAEKINEQVQAADLLYHLGDFSFGGLTKATVFREMLNVRRVILVRGNHDHVLSQDRCFQALFAQVVDLTELWVSRRKVILCHYPLESWAAKNYGSFHLHGHCHGRLERKLPRRLDVGVDCHHLRPLRLDWVLDSEGPGPGGGDRPGRAPGGDGAVLRRHEAPDRG
jgi:calcineurin-like phosphoesterase family protein